MSKRKSITVLGVLLVVFLALLLMVNAKKPEDTPGNPHDDLAECEERVASLEAENADLQQQLHDARNEAYDYMIKYEGAVMELENYKNLFSACKDCLDECYRLYTKDVGIEPDLPCYGLF